MLYIDGLTMNHFQLPRTCVGSTCFGGIPLSAHPGQTKSVIWQANSYKIVAKTESEFHTEIADLE